VLDEDVLGVIPQVVHDAGLDLGEGREVLQVAGGHVHGHHVEVLVAAEVLDVEDVAVALPEVAGDVAGRLRGDALGLGEVGSAAVGGQGHHVHVHAVLVGGHEAQHLPVGGDPEHGAFGVAEEGLDGVALGRGRAGGGKRRQGGGGQQATAQGAEEEG